METKLSLFLDGLKQEKIIYNSCQECQKEFLPPAYHCPQCGNEQLVTREAPLKGKIETFTIVHVAPANFLKEAPYAVGIVQLKEGLRIMARIKVDDVNSLKIGDSVQASFDKEKDDTSILYFTK